ncbi:MAG: peptidoglycan DD-metalloendopeptidase family protein [Paludibacter sp.]|jgi:septal ring factor EnvC (AmiA/AmiB activator)|nr:peptidoglycan DD-metalloendopeptidase family protein [Paludibacter sp.]
MKNFYIIILLLLVFAFSAAAQTRKELERQKQQTLEQLETTGKMLDEAKKSQSSSLNKLNLLNKNISERQKLINNMSREINALDGEMTRLNRETTKLNSKLAELKADYARLIEETHRQNTVYTKIMFVLSADGFHQSFRRFRYLQEFTEYRKSQVQNIEQTKTFLILKTDSLDKNKVTKVGLVEQQKSENQKLTRNQREEREVYNILGRQKKKLENDYKVQQQKAEQLNNKIEQLIAEEIRKAEEKAKKSETKTDAGKTQKTENYALTKEEKLVSGNFEANKGRLPLPVERGYISGHYGVQPHPVHTRVTINNKGIYIQTPANSNARAVFEGVVTQCFSVAGSGNSVIVQHGEYRSIYSNLSDLYVKVGDKIKTKQNIGKIYTDSDGDNKTELYFQIRKGMTVLNPETWVIK